MRTSLVIFCGLTLLAGGLANAGQPPKEESIGIGSGAVIGAIAGGPVGFIVGAAIGAKVGDTVYQKNTKIDALNVSLQRSQGDLRHLNSSYEQVSDELQRLQATARPQLVSMLEAGIAMDLLFRTDETVLADTTGARLAALGNRLATMTDVQVQLDGFADERGDADYNYALSMQRVEFVREQLVAAGIDPSRIHAAAHGEAAAQDATPDSYALERRVSLTLFIDDTPSVAQLP